MTVLSVTDPVRAAGNGVATVFSFSPMKIFATGDIKVIKVVAGVETVLVEGAAAGQYSVSILDTENLPSVGSITYPSTGSPLAIGESLVIRYDIDLTQPTNLSNQGGYFPEVLEQSLDRGALINIQQQEALDRSIKIPSGSSTGVTVELPAPAAGQLLGWNGAATALTNISPTLAVDISNSLLVVSGVQPGLVDGRIWIDTSVGGQRVVRVCDGSDYNDIIRFATAGGAEQISNPITISANNTDIVATGDPATNKPLLVEHRHNSATQSMFQLIRNKGTGVAALNGDPLMGIQWVGNDSAGNLTNYAHMRAVIGNAADGGEGGSLVFNTTRGLGVPADRMTINSGLVMGAATGGDQGQGTINATGLYLNGVGVANPTINFQSGTTHTPLLVDHGATIIYTNAAGCTVTMPAASTLFAGWYVRMVNASTGVITVNRASTDVLISKNTSLTALKLPIAGDSGIFALDSIGGSAKFYWFGKRTFESAEITVSASTVNNQAHNLSVSPSDHSIHIRAKAVTDGWTVGDELGVNSGRCDIAAAAWQKSLVFDGSNGYYVQGAAGTTTTYPVHNKGTGAVVAGAAGDYKLFWRAWVLN